jgi:hypothetical protein
MQDLEKYLNTARKAQLDNVPFDKESIDSILQKHREAGSQNFFKKIISKYGKLKMYSIMTFITATMLFLSSILLNIDGENPTLNAKDIMITKDCGATKSENFASNGKDAKEVVEDLVNEEENAKTGEEEDDSEYIDEITFKNQVLQSDTIIDRKIVSRLLDEFMETHSFKDTTITFYSTLGMKDESLIAWKDLEFDAKTWEFSANMNYCLNIKYDKDARSSIRNTKISITPEDSTLIRIHSVLEKELSDKVDIQFLKSLGFVDLEAFYSSLSEYIQNIESTSNDKSSLMKAVSMFAYLNRKLLNNPFKGYKFKDRGIVLSKNDLQNLDIQILEDRVLFPSTEIFCDEKLKAEYTKIYGAHFGDRFTPFEDSNNNMVVYKNSGYSWKWVEGTDTNWEKTVRYTYHGFENDHKDNKQKKARIGGYVAKVYNSPLSEKSIAITPVTNSIGISVSLHQKYLHDSNLQELKELYNLGTQRRITFDALNDYLEKPISERDSKKEEELKLASTTAEILAENALHTLQYSKLIPIEIPVPYGIHTEGELANRDYSSITLWYYPDAKFLDALPEDIHNQIVREMDLIESVIAGELPADEACSALGGKESLLGLCNLTEIAIKDFVSAPNPTSGDCRISYSLSEDRFTKLMLLDNSGRYVKDISDWTNQAAGNYDLNINISSLPSGKYIIAIFTNKNEKVSFKLIKK